MKSSRYIPKDEELMIEYQLQRLNRRMNDLLLQLGEMRWAEEAGALIECILRLDNIRSLKQISVIPIR
jgi:hypothetical protein